LQLEAYQLSSQALDLHRAGTISNSSSGEVLLLSAPVLVGGAQETQALDSLLLAVPLPLGRATTPEGAEAAGDVLRHSSFPSLLELQASEDCALGARAFVQRLVDALVADTLREDLPTGPGGRSSVRGKVDALRDPQLLLFLALQLGDVVPADSVEGAAEPAEQPGQGSSSPAAVLCRFLRATASADTAAGSPLSLPVEVAAVLDAARRSLQ
jgi:hypothetical protein